MMFSRHRQKIAQVNILAESKEVQARGPGRLQLPPGHREQAPGQGRHPQRVGPLRWRREGQEQCQL